MPDLSIRVRINHVPHELPQGATLADAIASAGIRPPFAAAVNLQFVPRQKYLEQVLQNDDQIELIAPITGG